MFSGGIKKMPVFHPEQIWGQLFQQGVWSTSLNTSKFFSDFYGFPHF